MKLLLIAALLLATMPAQALTGNEYMQYTDSAKVTLVTGLAYGFQASSTFNNMKEAWCLPADGVPFGQIRKILDKYLINNPEVLHHDIGISYFVAIETAFPCQPSRKTSGKGTRF